MKFDQDLWGTCDMNTNLGTVVPLAMFQYYYQTTSLFIWRESRLLLSCFFVAVWIANVNFQAGALQAAEDHCPHNHKHRHKGTPDQRDWVLKILIYVCLINLHYKFAISNLVLFCTKLTHNNSIQQWRPFHEIISGNSRAVYRWLSYKILLKNLDRTLASKCWQILSLKM